MFVSGHATFCQTANAFSMIVVAVGRSACFDASTCMENDTHDDGHTSGHPQGGPDYSGQGFWKLWSALPPAP